MGRKKPERATEVFVTEECSKGSIIGHWKPAKFHSLKKGDIFRLWDTDGQGERVPDLINPDTGKHDVSVAITDAQYSESADKAVALSPWFIEAQSVQGIVHEPS